MENANGVSDRGRLALTCLLETVFVIKTFLPTVRLRADSKSYHSLGRTCGKPRGCAFSSRRDVSTCSARPAGTSANGGGAAVRRADGEAAGEDRGEDGEQEPSRQSRRLQRLPLEAQRAPRHPEGRARVTTITREESVPTLVRVTADHRVASRGRSPSFPRRGLDPPLPTRSRPASRRFADASTSSGRFFTRPRRRPRRPRSRCPRPPPPSARTRRAS